MIEALAQASAALDEPRYAAAAAQAADFIRAELCRPDGRLLHTWRGGTAKLDAYLDDYAALACGLISLYEATFDGARLDEAARLLDIVLERFADREGSGFFYTADDHEQLIARNKDATDASVPSASGLAATALTRLGKLTGIAKYTDSADATLKASAGLMQQAPTAMGQMLLALDFHLGPTYELVLAGEAANEATQQSLREIRRRYLPNKVLAAGLGHAGRKPPDLLADLLSGKTATSGDPTLYVCEGFTCQEPAHGAAKIAAKLDVLTRR
jgi:uncharacterized protein YyaL (SSP411 family)